jgi:LysM repeat protein
VRRGDSISSIAYKFKTTVESIKALNRLKSNDLSVGQTLTIGSARPPGTKIYVVKKGDTLYSIAQAFKMKLSKLKRINNFGRRSRIYPGQQIWVIN